MASGYNSNLESDIVLNPCKNRPSSPLKPCIEESSSPVSPTIVQCAMDSIAQDPSVDESLSSFPDAVSQHMLEGPELPSEQIRPDGKEHKGTQYNLEDEMDSIAFQVMDDYMAQSRNDGEQLAALPKRKAK